MSVFVGIDLAWGTRNPSGICVIGSDGCSLECRVAPAVELAEFLDTLGPDIIVGVDAPLIVEEGRCAEAALARRMGRFGVYAHSSAAAVRRGYDQGIRLARELRARGFELAPRLPPRAAGRFALEVYPHAAHVVMFRLARIMPYKMKPGRSAANVNAELARYRARLSDWLQSEAPALTGEAAVVELLAAGALKGIRRKSHEDQLDALTCALMARAAWTHGLDHDDVLGDGERGYIAVPGLSRDPRFGGTLDCRAAGNNMGTSSVLNT